jgi:hypothetical protein
MMARFSKANAAEMGRRGGLAKKGVPNKATRAFKEFAAAVLSDEKVQAKILAQARRGELPAGTVTALISLVAGRPGPAPAAPPPPEETDTDLLRRRTAAAYEAMSPEERKVALTLARRRLGQPVTYEERVAALAGTFVPPGDAAQAPGR